jgi:transposase
MAKSNGDLRIQYKESGVHKAFKFRLYPNKATQQRLYTVLTRCRELYNAALSERKDAYQQFQRTTIIER